jgi:hypothetical protein
MFFLIILIKDEQKILSNLFQIYLFKINKYNYFFFEYNF